MIEEVEQLLAPLDRWACRCHAASLEIVRSGILGEPSRVARGWCRGVGAQHSWVVIGDDCYAPDARIIDPTLWSYDSEVDGIWTGNAADGLHHPHGGGLIWDWGRPQAGNGPVVELEPAKPFSQEAIDFIELLGPLDYDGWAGLAHAPVEGWPSGEIIAAIADKFPGLVPIDIIGMVTDRNPNGLYLPEKEAA